MTGSRYRLCRNIRENHVSFPLSEYNCIPDFKLQESGEILRMFPSIPATHLSIWNFSAANWDLEEYTASTAPVSLLKSEKLDQQSRAKFMRKFIASSDDKLVRLRNPVVDELVIPVRGNTGNRTSFPRATGTPQLEQTQWDNAIKSCWLWSGRGS